MKNNKKKEGFTLIELLATIVIVSLVFISTTFLVKNLIDKSNKDSKEITLKNIKESALTYTKEYKTDAGFWFEDKNDSNIQYACTTIGMLINKGILKESVLGTELEDGKKLSKDTSVKITRDTSTKVFYKEELAFNDTDCYENSEINVNFDIINGTKGNDNWYITPITVRVNVSGTQISTDDDAITYKVVDNNGTKDSNEIEDNEVSIAANGKEMDLVVMVKTTKDYTLEFKYKDIKDSTGISIDTEPPTKPKLQLTTADNYTITASDSTDNMTSNVIYYINEEQKNTIEQASSFRDTLNMVSYAEDEAGNRSDSVEATLTVNNSQTNDTYSDSVYTCSLYPNTPYTTEEELNSNTSNCTKQTTTNATVNYTYTCPDGYKEKGSGSNTTCTKTEDASYTTHYTCDYGYTLSGSTCYDEVSPTTSVEYSCPSGYTLSGSTCTRTSTATKTYYCGSSTSSSSTCTDTTTVEGWNQCVYVCNSSGTGWYYSPSLSSESRYGCPSGYSNVEWSCNYPCGSGKSGTCTPGESYAYGKGDCYNTCKKTYDATVKYECSSGYTLNGTTCYATTSATSTVVYSCPKGYSKSGSGSNTTCIDSYSADTAKDYYCKSGTLSGISCILSVDPNVDVNYTCSSGILNDTKCITTTTGTITHDTKFICPLTGKAHEKEDKATDECTNYCESGTKFKEGCYTYTGGL